MSLRGGFQDAWDSVANNKRIAYLFTKFINEHYNEHDEYISKWLPIFKTLELEDLLRVEQEYPGFLQFSREFNDKHKNQNIVFEKEFEELWNINLNVEDDLLSDGTEWQVDTNGDVYMTPQRKRTREPTFTAEGENKRITRYPPGGRDRRDLDLEQGMSLFNLRCSAHAIWISKKKYRRRYVGIRIRIKISK